MNTIVIFAGTTEGRTLSEALAEAGISHTICVATDYGEEILLEASNPFAHVHKGRMTAEEMTAFFRDGGYDTVVDATHPYAQIVTENIRSAAKKAGIRYLRLLRDMEHTAGRTDGAGNADSAGRASCEGQDCLPEMRYFPSTAACAEALRESSGNILLTTGSKELHIYAEQEDVRERLIARVLPGAESIALCEKSGIPGKRIIAMQGPFSEEMNLALIHGFDVRILVTKMSGRTGGYGEKLSAAAKAGIPVWVVGRPSEDRGLTFAEVLRELGISDSSDAERLKAAAAEEKRACAAPEADTAEAEKAETETAQTETAEAEKAETEKTEKTGGRKIRFDITLAGIGMGDPGSMTVGCAEAIRNADLLFGASRMIEPYTPKIAKEPFYLSRDILPYLKTFAAERAAETEAAQLTENSAEAQAAGCDAGKASASCSVVILFSGDSGFFSGCEKMFHAIRDAIRQGEIEGTVRILPGISSISMLAAKTGVPYGNAAVLSLHGKKNWQEELLFAISKKRYAFMLTSGREDLPAIGALLKEHGFGNASVTYGYHMGSEEEALHTLSVEQCISGGEEDAPGQGLYTCLIDNPDAGESAAENAPAADASSAAKACSAAESNPAAGAADAAKACSAAESTPAADASDAAEEERIPLTHGLPDGAFVRGKVPMTKEEVREIVISKLHLFEGAVVYDVGAGTGSIAVEIGRRAAMQESGAAMTQIYAIEQNPDGIALIYENSQRLGAKGLHVVEGKAPEALKDLPAPTHVFIGGSSGGMKDILQLLYEKNPSVRVVITSVTLETVSEMSEIVKHFPVDEEEFTTVSVARSRKAGRYHLMTAENPVWILAFTFKAPSDTAD